MLCHFGPEIVGSVFFLFACLSGLQEKYSIQAESDQGCLFNREEACHLSVPKARRAQSLSHLGRLISTDISAHIRDLTSYA